MHIMIVINIHFMGRIYHFATTFFQHISYAVVLSWLKLVGLLGRMEIGPFEDSYPRDPRNLFTIQY